MKVFDVRDGHGVKMLLAAGLGVALLSARRSEIVSLRARELGVDQRAAGPIRQGAGSSTCSPTPRLIAELRLHR
jgi:3-deoxy-D-manno-octulosonate 8-phosphate phosphatase KdsC-like HAD superfamily phosphatase